MTDFEPIPLSFDPDFWDARAERAAIAAASLAVVTACAENKVVRAVAVTAGAASAVRSIKSGRMGSRMRDLQDQENLARLKQMDTDS